jgi:hypothetical protein
MDYLTIAEKHRNMIDEKLLMAQLLQKLHRPVEAVQKLEEALQLTDDQISYRQITEMIENYKKQ